MTSVSAGVALLVLALSFLLGGGLTGVVTYTVFGLVTLLSPLVDQSSSPGEEGVDRFVLAAAVTAVANGIVLLIFPGPSAGSLYSLMGLPISPYAVLFLVGAPVRWWPACGLGPRRSGAASRRSCLGSCT